MHLLLASTLSTLLAVLPLFDSTLTPTASACSITAPSRTAKFVYFTGKATKRELISDDIWPTYRWTFTIKKWDRDSSGKRRKVGSTIAVSVVEIRRAPTSGAVNSCSDIELGINTEFQRNKVYTVTAEINEPEVGYTINRYAGRLR